MLTAVKFGLIAMLIFGTAGTARIDSQEPTDSETFTVTLRDNNSVVMTDPSWDPAANQLSSGLYRFPHQDVPQGQLPASEAPYSVTVTDGAGQPVPVTQTAITYSDGSLQRIEMQDDGGRF